MKIRPALRVLAGFVLVASLAAACSSDLEPSGATGAPGEALQRALAAHAEGRLDEASELYQQVLVLDPENKYAYYNLGLIEQTQGDTTAAVDYYDQAISVDPAFVPALFNLATIRSEEGDDRAAKDLYQQVIAVNPEHAGAHLNLGFLLIDAGKREKGQAELELAVQLDPSLESRIPDRLLVVGDTTGP